MSQSPYVIYTLEIQILARFLWLKTLSSVFFREKLKYGRKIGQHFYAHMSVLLSCLQKYVFLLHSHVKFKLRGVDLIPVCLRFTGPKTKQSEIVESGRKIRKTFFLYFDFEE